MLTSMWSNDSRGRWSQNINGDVTSRLLHNYIIMFGFVRQVFCLICIVMLNVENVI